jgi:membrane protein YqaA with SNARE-associated domain
MTLFALWLTTFGVCVVGAFVPIVNTEIYLLSVSALSPAEFIGPLVLAATVGQMTGKIGMFYAGRGVLKLRNEKVRDKVLAIRARLDERPWVAKATLFSSATFGMPPLYIMSIACGTIGMGLVSFIVIGFLGRLIHFAFVALLPQLATSFLG